MCEYHTKSMSTRLSFQYENKWMLEWSLQKATKQDYDLNHIPHSLKYQVLQLLSISNVLTNHRNVAGAVSRGCIWSGECGLAGIASSMSHTHRIECQSPGGIGPLGSLCS